MAALIAPLLISARPFDQRLEELLDTELADSGALHSDDEPLDLTDLVDLHNATTSLDSDTDIDINLVVAEPEPPARPEFEVVLADGSTESILGASAYAQEGQMTTFFRTGEDDPIIDAWSERLTSIRTTDIRLIRRR